MTQSAKRLQSKIPRPVKPSGRGRGRGIPKLGGGKGIKAPTNLGRGFNAPKSIGRGFKSPKAFRSPKIPRGRMGATDPVEGVIGVMNMADGLLRITGKKEQVGKAAQDVAYGSRNRAKATNILSNTAHWIQEEQEPSKAWYYPQAMRSWKLRKDLITNSKKILEDTDKEWDEMEAAAEDEEDDEAEETPQRQKRRRRRRI